MRDNDIDYERDVRIDESALDVEWLNQPSLALKYARLSAYWNDMVRRLDERKKTIRSELILKVNANPAALLGKDKPNAGDIEAYYRADTGYQSVVSELNDAMKESEYANLAKDEICYTRKKALENLVVLHGQQYFAGPTVPRDLSAEYRRKESQRVTNAKIKITRSRKPSTDQVEE
ncbi:MAG: hypothetical protein WC992_03520 [Acholeplasmataceae bacterium]